MMTYNLLRLLMVVGILSSCASIEPNQSDVSIEIDSSIHAKIFNVRVTSIDSIFTVSGTLHKQHHSRTVIPGHIDLAIVSPDGEVLYESITKYPRRSLKARESKFRVEIPMELPNGSTVLVKHHRTKHRSTQNC